MFFSNDEQRRAVFARMGSRHLAGASDFKTASDILSEQKANRPAAIFKLVSSGVVDPDNLSGGDLNLLKEELDRYEKARANFLNYLDDEANISHLRRRVLEDKFALDQNKFKTYIGKEPLEISTKLGIPIEVVDTALTYGVNPNEVDISKFYSKDKTLEENLDRMHYLLGINPDLDVKDPAALLVESIGVGNKPRFDSLLSNIKKVYAKRLLDEKGEVADDSKLDSYLGRFAHYDWDLWNSYKGDNTDAFVNSLNGLKRELGDTIDTYKVSPTVGFLEEEKPRPTNTLTSDVMTVMAGGLDSSRLKDMKNVVYEGDINKLYSDYMNVYGEIRPISGDVFKKELMGILDDDKRYKELRKVIR